MAITYPLSLPSSPGLKSLRLTMRNVVGISESPTTLSQQVLDWVGDAWLAQAVLPRMATRAQAEPWLCMLAALNGPVGTVLIGDPSAKTPRGSWAGTPVCNGATLARSRTLALKGFTPNVTGIVKAGDYLSLGSGTSTRLYRSLLDADSDSSGNLELDIWPALRAPTSDGLAVVFSNAKGCFRLADRDRSWSLDEMLQYPDVTLNLREAL